MENAKSLSGPETELTTNNATDNATDNITEYENNATKDENSDPRNLPRRYPDFQVVQRLLVSRNFLLERRRDEYSISWWCASYGKDIQNLERSQPTLSATMAAVDRDSNFALLDAKLRAFGCEPLDFYIFQNSGRLLARSEELGGKRFGFDAPERTSDLYGYGSSYGFTYQFDNENAAEEEYERIMQSPAAKELSPSSFRFRFRNVAGGRQRAYTVFEGISGENDIGSPITNQRLAEIFSETYTAYPYGAKHPELKLLVDPTTLQSYIVTDEDYGASLRLDPKKFIAKRCRA